MVQPPQQHSCPHPLRPWQASTTLKKGCKWYSLVVLLVKPAQPHLVVVQNVAVATTLTTKLTILTGLHFTYIDYPKEQASAA